MKKTISIVAALCFSLTLYGQGNSGNNQANNGNSNGVGWGANNDFTSLIKPNESRGYILWNPVPNADYVVNIYEMQSTGNLSLIATKSTDNNYARLSGYLSNPDAYYSISAYNSGNGTLIVEGNPQAINGLPPESMCTKKCNGVDYAYEFNLMEAEATVGQGERWLMVSPTNDVVDNANGIIIPFWQAISTSQYNQLPPLHPYKRVTANGPIGPAIYEYKHAQIINGGAMFNGEAIGGPFFDAQNNVVTDGWLIEKKLNKYYHFGTSRTTAQPDLNLCSADMNFWVNFYNNGNPYGFQQVSTDLEYFIGPITVNNPIPSELACVPALNGTTGGDDDCCNTFEMVNDFLDCIVLATWDPEQGQESEAWFDCWDELEDPDPVVGVHINPFDMNENFTLSAGIDSMGNLNVIDQVGSISDGLYKITLYTSSGTVIPSVFEHRSKKIHDKDRVKLDVTPNPIANNELKFKISSEEVIDTQIEVISLDGTTLYSETVTLSNATDLHRTIPVAANTPYNQIRVNLIFNDGSMIQKTALH